MPTHLRIALGLLAPVALAPAALAYPAPAQAASAKAASATSDPIDWHSGSFASALRRAEAGERLVAVYFWMDGSAFCEKLYAETLKNPASAQHLSDVVSFSAKATDREGAELVQRYGVTTLPTLLFLTPKGTAEDAIIGFIDTANFGLELQRIKGGQSTVSALRTQCDAAPDDLALRLRLATKLDRVGDKAGGRELLDSIKRDDPEGETVVGAQLHLYDVMTAVRDAAADPADLLTYDLKPLYEHVGSIQPGPVVFEAWNWLGNAERTRGNRKKARAAFETAWKHVPDNQLREWGAELILGLWNEREELSRKERALAMDVAQACVEVSRAEFEETEEGTDAADEARTRLAGTLDNLARAYHMNKKRRQALTAVRESVALDPGVPAHQNLLELIENR